MRIPPYHRMPDRQRFLAGCIIGVLVGFSFFLFLFGAAQERQIDKIREQGAEIQMLEKQKKALIDAEERKNEQLEKKMTVQEIDVTIADASLEKAARTELEQAVADELNSVINHSIESVADNQQLIEKAIERKPFTAAEITYRFHVKSMVIFSKLTLLLEVSEKKDNSR
ncbi:sporulation membrane protein YtrI [Sporolactobacillus putidus]|uniref:Sporulation membrane protein YtrI C-terminal domain-containing protein n=1 Tax=Sporolactobacillus putidus TaxID=492735 RepID=A0A917RY85_9BACL|nr:sporulation membrane protein YtrI [Sporolactobacillus putidus]GGL42186.1 hypothetical protein GCM10007968_02590 [Sporolactobacillus putidus]